MRQLVRGVERQTLGGCRLLLHFARSGRQLGWLAQADRPDMGRCWQLADLDRE